MKFTSLTVAALCASASIASAADLPPAEPTLKMLDAIKDWEPIFDGSTLNGWKSDNDKPIEGYEVQDGAIVCVPKKGTVIQTQKEYADFVLDFEFKLQPGSNNGIGIHYPGKGDAAYVGMEIQVLDDHHEMYKTIAPWQFHGSVYGVQPSTQSEVNRLKPTGEWNREQILCIGDHVKVILNGTTITDVYLTGKKPIHEAKHPGLERKTGTIAFCGHGDYVAYKNLKVKSFTPATPLLSGNPDNTAPAGFTPLFNGKDLTGWKGLLSGPAEFPAGRRDLSPGQLAELQKAADEVMKNAWSASNGEIHYTGKGKSLCTDKKYGDFDFYVDWKIPQNADSGIYLRGLPQVQIWDPTDASQFGNGAQKGSGGLWNNKGVGKEGKDPLVLADKPTGQWNTFYIRMVGDRVTVFLNGKEVVHNCILENLWKPAEAIPRADQIELQNHGHELAFKNLYIRELPY